MMVANYQVKRIMVDIGSSVNILFAPTHDYLHLGKEILQPIRMPLIGFSREKAYPLGSITLPVIAETTLKSFTIMVNFIMLDCPSAYNIFLGRLALNTLRPVPSTYHLLLRFPTFCGIGEIRGDQVATRECYVTSMRVRKPQETLQVEVLDPRDDNTLERGELAEELEPVELVEILLGRRIYIGSLFF